MKNKAWTYLSSYVTNIICQTLGIATGIISARLLGPAARGELAVISYFPGLVAATFSLAIPQALTFFISKKPVNENEIASAGLRLSIASGIAGSLIFAMLTPCILADENRYLSMYVSMACLLAPAMIINPHMYAIHRGKHRFNWVNSMLVTVSAGYLCILLLLWHANAFTAFYAAIAALILQTAVATANVWRMGTDVIRCSVSWQTYKQCLYYGLKFFVPVLAATLFVMSDRAVLIRTTTLSEIGLYSVAFAIASPLTLMPETISQIAFVEISGEHNVSTSISLIARRFQMAQMLTVLAAILVLTTTGSIIRYGFGAQFLQAITATKFLVVAMSIRGLSRNLEFAFRAKSYSWPTTTANVTALCFLVGFGAWLVPNGGVQSFTQVLLFSEMAGLCIQIYCMHRLLGISISDFWGLRPDIFRALMHNLQTSVGLSRT